MTALFSAVRAAPFGYYDCKVERKRRATEIIIIRPIAKRRRSRRKDSSWREIGRGMASGQNWQPSQFPLSRLQKVSRLLNLGRCSWTLFAPLPGTLPGAIMRTVSKALAMVRASTVLSAEKTADSMGNARHLISFVPRLLPAPQAAAYLGISETNLSSLKLSRKILGGKRLYDRLTLDAYADDLATEGESVPDKNEW